MASLLIHADLGTHVIDRHIYGHFSEHLGRCIYGGYWVGEDSAIPNIRGIRTDVVEALRAIRIPNLRWPGGCFADEYHWMDGIGPRENRPRMINTHWGGVTEDNRFGTHEFLDLCGQLECEPYICGNLGSGTVQEMSQWVEYVNSDAKSPMADLRRANGREEPWGVKFWGVGNENWGCGGNMRPEYYADEYRRYQCYCRSYGENKLYKIACGPNGENYHWTDVLMREAAGRMAGLALHYYAGMGGEGLAKSATEFGQAEWFYIVKKAGRMEELISKHAAVMDRYDPEQRVAMIVDEWGTWYAVEPETNPGFLYQQNTLRDAMVAALTLNIFNDHCDRVRMANIAQTVNVLQAMILTEGDKMLLTPSYHVFEMYKVHQNAMLLPVELDAGQYEFEGDSVCQVSASASRDEQGKVNISLVNVDPERTVEIAVEVRGMACSTVSGRILTAEAMNAHNTFDVADAVGPVEFDGARIRGGQLAVKLPAKSVVVLTLT